MLKFLDLRCPLITVFIGLMLSACHLKPVSGAGEVIVRKYVHVPAKLEPVYDGERSSLQWSLESQNFSVIHGLGRRLSQPLRLVFSREGLPGLEGAGIVKLRITRQTNGWGRVDDVGLYACRKGAKISNKIQLISPVQWNNSRAFDEYELPAVVLQKSTCFDYIVALKAYDRPVKAMFIKAELIIQK